MSDVGAAWKVRKTFKAMASDECVCWLEILVGITEIPVAALARQGRVLNSF